MGDTVDPFPLFHLANLDFRCTNSSLNELATFQLALAPWSAEWDDSLESPLKRLWRRRREKVRSQIAARAPMGIFSSNQDLHKEQFPNYELIDLSFDLANLEELTSAQLAAVVFHPSSTKDLVMDAEDIFFRRRERDFAAGLSLPTDMKTLSSSTASQTSSTPSQTPSSRLPPSIPRDSTFAPSRPPPPPAPPAAASSSSSARPTSNFEGDNSPMPFSLPGMRPSTYTSNASPSRAPPSMVDSHQPRNESDETERRRLSMADYRERQQEKERAEEQERHLKREAELRRNLEREMERNRSRDRVGIPSGPSSREANNRPGPPPTASTRDYRDTRRSSPPMQRKREHSPPRNVDLRESTRRRTDDYPPPPSRSNEPYRDTRPSERNRDQDRSRDSRPLVNDRSRDDERERLPPRATDSREPRRRTPSPRRAPASVQSSQPVIPRPSPEDWIPPRLQETLSTVFIRFFPPQSKEQDVLDFLSAVAPDVTRPIAIKFGIQRKAKRVASGDNRDGWYYAFAVFERRDDAVRVKEKADQARWNGLEFICSWASETNQSVWKWSAFPADFVENWYQSEVARASDPGSSKPSSDAPPANAPSGPRSLSSRMGPLPSAAPSASSSRPQASAPRERRLSTSSTSNSVFGTAASASNGITTVVQRLPKHLKDLLWEMFVDNLPRDVTVRSCRDFFDVCDGIVGLAIPPQAYSGSTSSCWLAFSTKSERARSMDRLRGSKFPGGSMKLWMEHGEERKAKGLSSTYEWTWGEMSKEYRNSRLEDYQRSTAHQETPAPRPEHPRPVQYSNMPPDPTNSMTANIGYSPFQPVMTFPPPLPPPQQQSATPIDPFYASYGTPWQPNEFSSTVSNDTQRSSEVATPAKAGIHPSRLAILAQADQLEEPYSRGPEVSQAFDTGSTVVQEKQMIENAYGARKRRAESNASSTNMPQGDGSNSIPSGNESVIVAIRGVAQSPPIPSLPRVSASPTPQVTNSDYSMVPQTVRNDMPTQLGGGGGADSFLDALNLPPNASLPIPNESTNPPDTSTVSSSTVIADTEEQSKETDTRMNQDVDVPESTAGTSVTGAGENANVEVDTQMESQEEGNKEETETTA